MSDSILIATIAASPGVAALIISLYKARSEKQKTKAETTEKIAAAADKVVDLMKEQIAMLERRVRALEEVISKLESQLEAAGLVPITKPANILTEE